MKTKTLAALVKANPEQAAELLEAVLFSYQDKKGDWGTLNAGVVNAIRAFANGRAKKTWLVRYEHRYGTDVWMVRASKRPSTERVIKACEVDFEEDREETLYVAAPTCVDLEEAEARLLAK